MQQTFTAYRPLLLWFLFTVCLQFTYYSILTEVWYNFAENSFLTQANNSNELLKWA